MKKAYIKQPAYRKIEETDEYILYRSCENNRTTYYDKRTHEITYKEHDGYPFQKEEDYNTEEDEQGVPGI